MSVQGRTITPYDLITEDLVDKAVKHDVGPKAYAISWETKDFTHKGDNYMSSVTSITVKYQYNGNICEKSYVAKLNPLRPVSVFTEIMEAMYAREAAVLGEIFDGMNIQLKKLDLLPLKTPRLYSRCLDNSKEVFIIEDLRPHGFKMYDRSKGMTLEQALLVVEELGRIHATSVLYEKTISPKTIHEVFNEYGEPWNDPARPSTIFFNNMTSTQCKAACEFFKNDPKYEKCAKWINKNMKTIEKLYIEGTASVKTIDVLNHGDCWTNNILFKYDDEGVAVDMRFVDLQCSRMASPACDLNYFYYASLNGDLRKKYRKTIDEAYYNSFQNVFEIAGKEPPFTFSDFEDEMINKRQFGLMTGLLVLPVILAESEEEILDFNKIGKDNLDEFMDNQSSKFSKVAQKEEGAFKDRYLSMFDEMLEYKVFDD